MKKGCPPTPVTDCRWGQEVHQPHFEPLGPHEPYKCGERQFLEGSDVTDQPRQPRLQQGEGDQGEKNRGHAVNKFTTLCDMFQGVHHQSKIILLDVVCEFGYVKIMSFAQINRAICTFRLSVFGVMRAYK